jgi:lysophospholipase L1-like esterase
MQRKFTLPFVIVFAIATLPAFAQKKIVILGSSTAAGNAASPIDSSWANRLSFYYNRNNGDGIDTTITNLAMPGYVTYHAMYTGFPTPANRTTWPVDPARNITKALSLNPDVIIISFPSNDVAITPDYDMKETMDNFRSMFQRATSQGVRCYITTMQPRNEMDDARRQMLRQLVDSIKINFGLYAIDVWTPLATTDGQNNMRPEVNADNIHPNNLGHRYIFQSIAAQGIFGAAAAPLPLTLTDFSAGLQNNSVVLKWKTQQEEPNTFFDIQRSRNGRDFETLEHVKASGRSEYSWIDGKALENKNFYRLKIVEQTKTSYSKVLDINFKAKPLFIQKLFTNSSELHMEVSSTKNQSAIISIMNMAGGVINKQTAQISANTQIVMNISALSAGEYIVSVVSSDGNKEVKRFTRLK